MDARRDGVVPRGIQFRDFNDPNVGHVRFPGPNEWWWWSVICKRNLLPRESFREPCPSISRPVVWWLSIKIMWKLIRLRTDRIPERFRVAFSSNMEGVRKRDDDDGRVHARYGNCRAIMGLGEVTHYTRFDTGRNVRRFSSQRPDDEMQGKAVCELQRKTLGGHWKRRPPLDEEQRHTWRGTRTGMSFTV